jgi:hypothetical protein
MKIEKLETNLHCKGLWYACFNEVIHKINEIIDRINAIETVCEENSKKAQD